MFKRVFNDFMSMRALHLLALFALFVIAIPAVAVDLKPTQKPKAIKALLVTGGCCHDYTKQKNIIAEGIQARSKVPIRWTIVQQGGKTTNTKIDVYKKDDWYKGYDIVIHNECFAAVKDPAWTARVLKAHKEGVPAMVIHCAMHCYRDKTDEWFKFCGVTSHGHGAHYAFDVKNLAKDNPIMAKFGESWMTPKGELYLIHKLWPTATPLAHAYSKNTKKNEVCIWTNAYGEKKTRVFGTTIGHHNETMSDPKYLDMLTRGFMWAADRLDEKLLQPGKAISLGTGNNIKPAIPTGAKEYDFENLAAGKSTTAKGNQAGHLPSNAVDGNSETRWCAPDGGSGYWWQVDLTVPQTLTGTRIHWEHAKRYNYKVEGSADGKAWKMLVDRTTQPNTSQIDEAKFMAEGIRYLRTTVLKQEPGSWCSFWEFEALGTKKVLVSAKKKPKNTKLPKNSATHVAGDGLLKDVRVPDGFEATLFAAPPKVNYPVCIHATPYGTLFVGVDQNGSLARDPNRGWVTKCVDKDGDGKADEFKQFCKIDSPRGLFWDGGKDKGTLYVLHPPDLSAYHDDDGDGVADRKETLIKGIGFDLKFRGADHTTNGIHMGIDGWIYIAVGDYGFIKAVGADGREIQLKGGGIVRVRPDGSEMELYVRGLRNICDLAISPNMQMFTRDNTNDGGGWNVRLSHIVQSAHYGYPSLYKRFGDELMPPIIDYGGGSGTGALYINEPSLGEAYANALFTVDWGRSKIYHHPLTPSGATYKAEQNEFVSLSRPTDMDVDGLGNMYIGSWKGGKFKYDGPNVGYVIRMRRKGYKSTPLPDVTQMKSSDVVALLKSDSHTRRMTASFELARRKKDVASNQAGVKAIMQDKSNAINVRTAALWTLKQMLGEDFGKHAKYVVLLGDDDLRPHVLRAFLDRSTQILSSKANLILLKQGLEATDAPSRLAALIASGRNGNVGIASQVLLFTLDEDAAIQHAAVKALVALKAIDVTLADIDTGSSKTAKGSFRVLRELHEPAVISGLIQRLGQPDHPNRNGIVSTLARLYHTEGPYVYKAWWGTRPDTVGPYYKRAEWSQSPAIAIALQKEMTRGGESAKHVLLELDRHKVNLGDPTKMLVAMAKKDPAFAGQAIEMLLGQRKIADEAVPLFKDVASNSKAPLKAKVAAISGLTKVSSKESLQAAVTALELAGAHSGTRSVAPELKSARQAFVVAMNLRHHSLLFSELASKGNVFQSQLAYAVLLKIFKNRGLDKKVKKQIASTLTSAWSSPKSTAALLNAIAETKDANYNFQVKSLLEDKRPEVKAAAQMAGKSLGLIQGAKPKGPVVGNMKLEAVVALMLKEKGDVRKGEKLFAQLGCVACHTTKADQTPKGPFLGGISKRYKRKELTQSIMQPSIVIAQGFESQWFDLEDGSMLEGFVVKEGAAEIEIRTIQGVPHVIKTKDIFERGKRKSSMMPQDLMKNVSPKDLASILAFLESLKGK